MDFPSFLSFFPPFLSNQRFGSFLPPSSGFQRVIEGNRQNASFLSLWQCLNFLSSLAEAFKIENPVEGGKNPPKRWFERKGGKKKRKEWKSNELHLIWICVNFSFSSRPLACLPLLSVEHFTSPPLSRENFVQIKLI